MYNTSCFVVNWCVKISPKLVALNNHHGLGLSSEDGLSVSSASRGYSIGILEGPELPPQMSGDCCWYWFLVGNFVEMSPFGCLGFLLAGRLCSKKELSKSKDMHSVNHHKPWARKHLKATSQYWPVRARSGPAHTQEPGQAPAFEEETAGGSKWQQPCLQTTYHTQPEKHSVPHTSSEKVVFTPQAYFVV